MQPPAVPEVLQAQFPLLPSLDNLDNEGLFTVIEYRETASTHRRANLSNPGITDENVVQGELFSHRALHTENRRLHPAELAPNPAVDQLRAVIDDALRDALRPLSREIREVNTKVTALQASFGHWAIMQAQDFNLRLEAETGFQLVPFPNGTWPEGANFPPLTSINAIRNLGRPTLLEYTLEYGLRRERQKNLTDDQLRCKLYQHLGVWVVAERMGLMVA